MSIAEVIVEADGGSRGNPGPAGYGAIVCDGDNEILLERKGYLGITTNNVAEYSGLICGLTAAKELGARAVAVRMDSKLVVEQMNGNWKVRNAGLKPLWAQATQLSAEFDKVTYTWIPRKDNARADELANSAMDDGA